MLGLQIIDTIPASIYWKNTNGEYLGCNKYMTDMTSYTQEEIIGKTDYEMPWKTNANYLREIDKKVIQTGKECTIEECVKLDSEIMTFLTTKRPLYDSDNNLIGITGVSIDITEHKVLANLSRQQNQQIDELLGRYDVFLQNVSHESRNSVTPAAALIDVLSENYNQFDNNKRVEIIGEIKKSVLRLNTMVNNICTLAELTTDNKLSLTYSSFAKLIIQNTQSFERNFNCKIDFKTQDDFNMNFDYEKIKTVIFNLLFNSKQFTPSFSLKKTISVNLVRTNIYNSIPAVQCTIQDGGCGIEEGEEEAIFLPFIQGSKIKPATGGIGVGLAVCKQIIKAHVGNIWVENNLLSNGAVFSFVIPMNLSNDM